MRWWVHWSSQLLLATLPGGAVLNRFMQERVGLLRHLEQGTQFQNSQDIISLSLQSIKDIDGCRVAEFGTGWVPAVPVALGLCGAEVHTFDVAALTHRNYFQRTMNTWRHRLHELAESSGQSHAAVRTRFNKLASAVDLHEFCRMTGGCCVAPCDTAFLPDATGSFDLVISNLVLQCIPDELVVPVLRESARLLRPSGTAVHRIRLTDEYARGDSQRHQLHFLTYTRQTWNRWFNHRLKWQNRWRASQFLAAFHDVGLEPRVVHRHRDPDCVNYFRDIAVADDVPVRDEDDLATIGMDVVLCKPSTQVARTHDAGKTTTWSGKAAL
ncbi:MAG: class I SAM-dependent methyltransferase [Planctomycetota bacterium]|nr:MAG: class I SAM-dependent methyltransferase [Planctomycetota bacterium]